MQGTAAVVLAAALAAARASETRMGDQRVVIHGAGTAGLGIADMLRDVMVGAGLSPEEATRRFWCLDRQGLITDDRLADLLDFQRPYARPAAEVADWTRTGAGQGPSLADVVAHVHPTMLIGTSTQAGAFTEAVVRQMAAHVERPVIMPLSNPTSRAEAVPADLIAWTDGRALVATGSPFDPVGPRGDHLPDRPGQQRAGLPGPGARGRGGHGPAGSATACWPRPPTRSPACPTPRIRGAPLLPPVDNLREVSATVAVAVAEAAVADGLADVALDDPIQQIHQAMWQPEYPRVEAV